MANRARIYTNLSQITAASLLASLSGAQITSAGMDIPIQKLPLNVLADRGCKFEGSTTIIGLSMRSLNAISEPRYSVSIVRADSHAAALKSCEVFAALDSSGAVPLDKGLSSRLGIPAWSTCSKSGAKAGFSIFFACAEYRVIIDAQAARLKQKSSGPGYTPLTEYANKSSEKLAVALVKMIATHVETRKITTPGPRTSRGGPPKG